MQDTVLSSNNYSHSKKSNNSAEPDNWYHKLRANVKLPRDLKHEIYVKALKKGIAEDKERKGK